MSDPGLIPDLPELDDPWPDLAELGKRLAAVLPYLHVTMPILVSGDWGSGKTTLLEVVKRQVWAGRGHAIVFEAWRQEAESELFPALLRTVWRGLPEEVRQEPGRKRSFERVWRCAVTAAKAMGPAVAQAAGGPLLAAVVGAAVAVDDQTKAKVDPSATQKALRSTPSEELWTALDQFIASLSEDLKPLVILVDDLDRCSPTGAVALLDAIRTLVVHADRSPGQDAGSRQLRFVVALDRSVLTQAVARKYHDISRFEGNRYLEKIFPLTFDLPRPDAAAIRKVVRSCLGEDETTVTLRDVCSGPLARPIFANPRLVKRCINRLKLLLAFEADQRATNGAKDREEEQSKPIGDEEFQRLVVLVEWLAATERWPMLRRLLSRRPVDFWNRVKLALAGEQNSEPVEKAVVELFEEPDLKHWLEGTLQGSVKELYAADERLRKWGL